MTNWKLPKELEPYRKFILVANLYMNNPTLEEIDKEGDEGGNDVSYYVMHNQVGLLERLHDAGRLK